VNSFSVDLSQVKALEQVLRDAEADVVGEMRNIVNRGAFSVKKDWQRRWSGHQHIRGLPHTITYDTEVSRDTASAEIGPDKNRGGQAPLAHLIEYGSVNNPPLPGGAPALEAEAPKFEAAIAAKAEKLVTR
jgi:hypothetical protein